MKKQDLIKSNILTDKEAILKDLHKKLQKIRKDLQKQKDSITTFQDRFRDVQTEVSEKFVSMMTKLNLMRRDLMKAFAEVKKIKGIKKRDKNHLEELIMFVDDGLPFPPMYEPDESEQEMDENEFFKHFHQEEEAKSAHIFDDFMVKPKDKEQQDIRKVFIRLASRFHPDKAENAEQSEEYHKIMQKINEAYTRGDFAELLEIEALYTNGDLKVTPKFDQESETLAYLDREIEQKQRELELLEDQLKRTKLELKQVKGSEIGKIVKRYDKEVKNGSFQEQVEHLEKMQTMLKALQDIMEEIKRTGKVDDYKIEEILSKAAAEAGFQPVSEEEMMKEMEAEILEMLFAEFESREKPKGKRGRR